jgi:FkbM family methyltransferase
MMRSKFVHGAYAVLRDTPILGAGIQRLVQEAIPSGARMWIRIPEGLGKGSWMFADPRAELGYTNGDHEPWIQELLKSELREGDCYYDVGAHTGFFCLIASRFVGQSGRVVAFEPDPDNAAILRANVTKNDITQVDVMEMAVWSSTVNVTFDRAPEVSNRTAGHIALLGGPGLTHVLVPALRLDEVVFKEGRLAPQLIKMDVEGAEWDALQGAHRLLDEAKPKLLCEVHDPNEMGRICDYLKQFGYVVEEWKPVHPHYEDYRQLYLWAVPSHETAAARKRDGA